MGATLASATFYSEDASSPQTATKPVGTASGDLLVYAIAQGDSVIANLTAPVGWTATSSANGGSVTGKVWTKVAGGSEPGTYDFPYSAGADVAAVMMLVTGEDATPVIVQAAGTAGPNAGSVDSPTVTPTGADDLLIVVMAVAAGGTTLSKTYPSGTTGLGQGQVAGGFQAISSAYQQLVSSAATGAKTWTSILPATKPGVTFSLAIKSASGGGAAPAFVPAQPSRRRLALRPFRARISTPVRAQVNPPFPVGAVVDPPRRLRGLLARRPRVATPVPAQVVVAAPTYPPAPERERLKGLRLFRPRAVAPVPPQVVFVAAAYPPQSVRTRLRGLRLFRGHAATPVPPQIVVAPAPYVPTAVRGRLKLPAIRRHDNVQPFIDQAAPPQLDPRPRPKFRPVRGRVVIPPAPQPSPVVPLLTRVKLRLVKAVRGKVRPVVPPQVILIAPPRVAQATRARRNQFAARRHRGGVDGWMVPGVHLCVTPRPSTGITAWDAGITTRPDTGITEAPC